MWLTNVSIHRPVFITMVVMALIVLGLTSMGKMPVDLNPNVEIPYVVITTVYPGAGPEEIEDLISKPLEDAVSSVNNVKHVTSNSQENISLVSVEFYLGTNLDVALGDVRSRVDAAKRQLPNDAESPVLTKVDINAQPVLFMGMSGNMPSRDLRFLADDLIKDRLGKVPGVASVTITGGEQREILVAVSRSRLEAYGISINQVSQALSTGNLNLPAGRITEGPRDYSIRTLGQFSSVDEIKNLEISLPTGGGMNKTSIALGDIAQVYDTVAEPQELTRLDRKTSVGILILKQSGANTVKVSEGVKAELAKLKPLLPPSVEIGTNQDQAVQVEETLADVKMSLILGALLAVLIVFLFLHNIRGTFIVAIAIPTSIISTFIITYFAGFTLNSMTMMALSLSVGILVDDSIVVLENIYRHLAKGESPPEAALNGRSEIGLAAITITLVDVVVFVPIAFMGGIVGQFFRQFGLTVATATLFSLFMSFTLTPMLASRWYRKGEAVEVKTGFFALFDRFYHALDVRYRSLLAWALRHRWTVVGSGVGVLFLAMAVGMPQLGFSFFPESDEGRVGVTVEMPAGTSLEVTNRVISRVEDVFAADKDVESIFTNVGSTSAGFFGAGNTGVQYGQVAVKLRDKEGVADKILHPFNKMRKRADTEIAANVRKALEGVPGARIKVSNMSGFGGSPIEIELSGRDFNQLRQASEMVRERVSKIPGVLNMDLSWKIGKPEIQAHIDRVKAAEMGLSVGQIASALRTSLEGSTDTRYREGGKEYDIRVQLADFDRNSIENMGTLVVGNTRSGAPIYLSDVASITRESGPTKIDRKDRQRIVTVTGDLAPGYPLGNMQQTINAEIAKISMPGVSVQWGGEAQAMVESGGYMGQALLLAIILVFMLMAALFESLLSPLIIMFSLPMAMVGAIIALIITGETLSVVAMIGFIMLMGLVTKNAILLVDYTNTLRASGKERNEAILEAGPTRLRPILMTTFAMIFGMLPTALKLGQGSEWRAPMAIAVIGGLILSTLLTLVMIPVVYTIIDDLRLKNIRARRAARRAGRIQGDGHGDVSSGSVSESARVAPHIESDKV